MNESQRLMRIAELVCLLGVDRHQAQEILALEQQAQEEDGSPLDSLASQWQRAHAQSATCRAA